MRVYEAQNTMFGAITLPVPPAVLASGTQWKQTEVTVQLPCNHQRALLGLHDPDLVISSVVLVIRTSPSRS